MLGRVHNGLPPPRTALVCTRDGTCPLALMTCPNWLIIILAVVTVVMVRRLITLAVVTVLIVADPPLVEPSAQSCVLHRPADPPAVLGPRPIRPPAALARGGLWPDRCMTVHTRCLRASATAST